MGGHYKCRCFAGESNSKEETQKIAMSLLLSPADENFVSLDAFLDENA